MTERSFFAEFPVAGSRLKKLGSVEQARTWVEKEQKYWAFILNASGTLNNISVVVQIRDAYKTFFQKFGEALSRPEEAQTLLVAAANILDPGGPIFSDGEYVDGVEAIKQYFKPKGDAFAIVGVCAALGLKRRQQLIEPTFFQSFNSPAMYEGISIFTAYITKPKDKIEALKLYGDAAESLNAQLANQEARSVEADKIAREALEAFRVQAEATLERINQSVNDALDRIEKVREAYAIHMQLKAPVEYWSEKASRHANMIKTYRLWAVIFVICSLLVLVLTYYFGWMLLHSNISNGASEVANTIYVGGFIAAVTAISLWVVRIVIRLYMSQHHLTIDAEERAAMLKTFLALSEEKKVGDTELGLILSAIFRPTPDGIIKDEGAPMPIGIGSLLGAALDSKSK